MGSVPESMPNLSVAEAHRPGWSEHAQHGWRAMSLGVLLRPGSAVAPFGLAAGYSGPLVPASHPDRATSGLTAFTAAIGHATRHGRNVFIGKLIWPGLTSR